MPSRLRARGMIARLVGALSILALLLVLASASSPAATGGTVVGATVLSATSIDPAGCASGVTGRTEFGSITPGSSSITTIDCSVAFGSSNDTAQLRMAQSDRLGGGMWMPTTGKLDAAFDGPSGTANGAFAQQIGPGDEYGHDLVVQPDGKIVVLAQCFAATSDFCLARYETNGTLDVTFDGPSGSANGTFVLPVGTASDMGTSIILQPDGKLVAAGACGIAASSDFCIVRFNSDGSLDATFDGPSGTGNGKFLLPIGAGIDQGDDVALQTDGKLVVGGYCNVGANRDFCLARLNPDGSLDPAFDGPSGTGNGKFIYSVGATHDEIDSVIVQTDGRIVALGTCNNGANNDFCLTRFNADGSLDLSFDGPSGAANGAFLLPIGAASDSARVVLQQANGRIVAGGNCSNGSNRDLCIARFNLDGSFDTTFDGPSGTGNGLFLVPLAGWNDWMDGFLIDADQQIVASGACWVASYDDFCLARLRADGSLDPTFDGPTGSGNGIILTEISAAGDNQAWAVAEQPDGELVATGFCNNGTNDILCLASYSAGGAFDDYVTGGGSDRDWLSGPSTSFFATCLRAVSGGASAVWSVSDPCPATDGAYWNDVPAASEKIATTAALEPDPVDATAHLRFALRAANAQPPGRYIAPITFDVLAPS